MCRGFVWSIGGRATRTPAVRQLDRPRRRLAIALAALAGFVDAVGFLTAGGYFASFMSGNTTRLGVDFANDPARALLPAALIALLTQNAWPFHMQPHPTAHDVKDAIDAGAWNDEDNTTFWIDHAEHGRVGPGVGASPFEEGCEGLGVLTIRSFSHARR